MTSSRPVHTTQQSLRPALQSRRKFTQKEQSKGLGVQLHGRPGRTAYLACTRPWATSLVPQREDSSLMEQKQGKAKGLGFKGFRSLLCESQWARRGRGVSAQHTLNSEKRQARGSPLEESEPVPEPSMAHHTV